MTFQRSVLTLICAWIRHMNFVEKILSVHPYKLTLQFNTGEVRVADLEPALRAKGVRADSAYGRLLDPETFRRARLDPESRTVCWDGLAREVKADGTEAPAPLDFCPDVLHDLSTPLSKPGNEQSDEDRQRVGNSGFVLKDKPRGLS